MRVVRKKPPKPARLIAYDFETTRIKPGTPDAVYITAFGADMHYASQIQGLNNLRLILKNNFLTEQKRGVKYVAWNGNNFDAYFVAAALVSDPDYVIRPYLTRSNAVRGLRVTLKTDPGDGGGEGWEFLDGMAMLGLVGVSLAKFLDNFAPDFPKAQGVIDFDKEEFDPLNPQHQFYAMRDSEGLYVAMRRAQDILIEAFDQPLAVTMGGACIKIFTANIPEDTEIATAPEHVLKIIRNYVMRGGYCYSARRYTGPVWKYDLNQAYAAAMREARLPAGFVSHTQYGVNRFASVYIGRVTATNARNKIPFYCRSETNGRLKAAFATTEIRDTWLTSIEINQLRNEGWRVTVAESYYWDDSFSMRDYVDKLERGRMQAAGGPSGPIGTVYKNVGNHSYGKTVEQLEPFEYVLAPYCPPGYAPYYPDDADDPMQHVFWRQMQPDEIRPKNYHQPQIGAFITAHVRMVVRRAALLSPDSFLYADTDCVVFDSDVTAKLDIHASRYGAWKVEEAGTVYQMIAKKVYTQVADEETRDAWQSADKDVREAARKRIKRSAKGMNVRRLSPEDFDAWSVGQPPVQDQVQRNNFLAVMHGAEMFRSQQRSGTSVANVESAQQK